MAKPVSLPLQTLYAELLDRAHMARLSTDFPIGGSFFVNTLKGRRYWYFQESNAGASTGPRRKRYVGPDTPELRRLIEAHREAKDDFRQRREMVTALLRAGFKGPDPITGRVLEAMADGGVFRMRAVVVGTVAYQTYSGLLGLKLADTSASTNDLDLAQFAAVSIAVEDTIDLPMEELLKSVDPGFRAIPHASHRQRVTQYALGNHYRVDVLVPNRGPDREDPVRLPALQADGLPLRFLDYLIYQEVRAVVLYGGGIVINVPAPERYALHKLIVSRVRLESAESQAKAVKDRRQAAELISVLSNQRPYELREAWEQMLSRGPGWRRRAIEGAKTLPLESLSALERTVGRIPDPA